MANGKPIPKVKKKTTSQLKKELDKVFSLYIRHKYARNETVSCYTCGVNKTIAEIQCGHFVSRSYLGTRFSEDNVRPQCVGCNIFGCGRTAIFATNLERDIRKGITTELYRKAQEIVKDYPYEKMIEHYQSKLKELQTTTI